MNALQSALTRNGLPTTADARGRLVGEGFTVEVYANGYTVAIDTPEAARAVTHRMGSTASDLLMDLAAAGFHAHA